MSPAMLHPILVYDGACGLCNRFVQFILGRDRNGTFRFASLQSNFAAEILRRHNLNPSAVDTVYVVVPASSPSDETELRSQSDAALFVLKQLGGAWSALAFLLQLVPRFCRDSAYHFIARRRYRMFGRYDTCPLPGPEHRSRFLDL